MKKVLIVGANGMLGSDLCQVFQKSGYDVCATTRESFDITNTQQVEDFFKNREFDLVINSAAYTKVDDAENNSELAFLINEKGASNLAKVTNNKNIPIIYISTDYVFDGKKDKPYLVSDETNPINVYGASKLAGEKETIKQNKKYYIVRTSWLYGKNGKNFVDTMISLAKNKDTIKVVDDQFGCPTWTFELAVAIKDLFENNNKFSTYQICGAGSCSWYEFAKEIFSLKNIDINVVPVHTKDFMRAANRPRFSAMSGNNLPLWNLSLRKYLLS